MFNAQKDFNFKEETKMLVLTKNQESDLVNEIVSLLNVDLEDLNGPVTKLNTLNKLKTKYVAFVDEDHLNDETKKDAAYKAMADVKEDAILLLDTFKKETITELFEGLTKATYRFNKFKSEDCSNTINIAYTDKKEYAEAIHEGIVLGEAINHTRELINTPYNYLNAEKLAEYAKALETIDNVKVTVYEKSDCEAMNMGAYLGVNKGSTDAPKLIHIEYMGNPDSKEITALVGKGVMYDTGGYSLKGVQNMPSMKMDMGGSATVLGAIEAATRLKVKANIHVVIAATDNRIGDYAIVPDDILTSAKGLTIEIISTDAEGRLTLADALWFAQEKGATRLIDVATLTGAVVGALGKTYTGAFTNNETFLNELMETAKTNKERLWQLPIHQDHHDDLKSFSADIKNSSGSRLAGSSVAAAFLQKFVDDDRAWVHLDIAGTAYESKSGGTGVLVKTLTNLFK